MLRIAGIILQIARRNPLALCALLSACSHTVVPIAAVPARAMLDTQTGRTGVLSLRIDVPPAGGHAAHYVGPSARSIAIALYSATRHKPIVANFDLTKVANSKCKLVAGGVVRCRIALSVRTGSYRGSFTVYDGALNGGAPTGHKLSANQQLPIYVPSYGVSIALGVYLNGVPASVSVAAPMGGSQADGFGLTACQRFPQTFTVEGLDADGNVMIGPSAPRASLVSNSPLLTVQPAGAATPNDFVVDAGTGTISGTGTLTAGATAPASARNRSAHATVNVATDPVHPSGCLLVANNQNEYPGVRNVTIYPPASAAPVSTIKAGIGDPWAFAFDASGDLYVADYGTTVTEYARNSATPMRTLTGSKEADALAFDGSGNLYVGNWGADFVYVYAPGATTPSRSISVKQPTALAFDSGGNLYVASWSAPISGGGVVTVFAPGASVPSKTLPVDDEAQALAFDGDGNLYVANYGANSITVFAPGASTASYTIVDGVSAPRALAVDSANNLYVANYGGSNVTVYAEGGSSPARTIPTGKYTWTLTVDGSGALYVATTNDVKIYAPGGSTPSETITAGVVSPIALALTP